MSHELETLDQLQGGELHLSIVATLFPSTGVFRRAVMGLLSCGDVILKGGIELHRFLVENTTCIS